jgi:hypothetical protein
MSLKNRVNPFGTLCVIAARGTMMGNRGGRIHDPATKTITRRWASKRWIACVCAFRGRQRAVMSAGYTELFFLDEVTALASGHRPCAECRRADFVRFSKFWCDAVSGDVMPKADDMDKVLHHERAISGAGPQPISSSELALLPDGAMFAIDETAYAMHDEFALHWQFDGYAKAVPLAALDTGGAHLLTPPALVKVLKAGYQPRWHSSAEV